MTPLRAGGLSSPHLPSHVGKQRDQEFMRQQAVTEQLQWGVLGSGTEGPTVARVLSTWAEPPSCPLPRGGEGTPVLGQVGLGHKKVGSAQPGHYLPLPSPLQCHP